MRNVITKEMKIYIQQQNQFVWKERNILSIVPNSLISIIWSSGQTYVEWKGEEIIDDGYLKSGIANIILKSFFFFGFFFFLLLGGCRSTLLLDLDLNIGHGSTSATQVSLGSVGVLGVVVCDGRFDGILGKHGAVHCNMLVSFFSRPKRRGNVHFTGGRQSSLAISVLRIRPASSRVIPRTNSVR